MANETPKVEEWMRDAAAEWFGENDGPMAAEMEDSLVEVIAKHAPVAEAAPTAKYAPVSGWGFSENIAVLPKEAAPTEFNEAEERIYIGSVLGCPAHSVADSVCICKPKWGHRSLDATWLAKAREAGR